MNKEKGFTLIEVLAIIIIIGIIALVAVPAVSKYIFSSKDMAYKTYEKSMESAAENKVFKCLSENENCVFEYDGGQRIYLQELIEDGLLDNMKDPNSDGYCEANQSYVNIIGNKPSEYKYDACLYCGNYISKDAVCESNYIESDTEKPICGPKTGESTRWINTNRTITVGCQDIGSGCLQNEFSKTFTNTTKVGVIAIRDKSGKAENVVNCEVNVYVDKENPTCEIEVEGDKIESVGWYSLNATGKIKNIKDQDSGVLSYGIGTSINNKDYNKKDTITVGNGITTIVGYVKDIAGNEGVCAKEVRVGTSIPIFNLYYGYQIGLKEENVSYTNINLNNNNLTTLTTNGIININELTKYKNIEKVRITLSSEIDEKTTAVLTYNGKNQNGIMSVGSKKIEFNVEKGTYSNITIKLGSLANKTYKVEKIELLTKEGNIWTNKNVTMYVEPIDKGAKTKEASFNNGSSWITTLNKTYSSTTSNRVKTKNMANLESEPVGFSLKIDKVMPTVTLKAEKNDGTVVATNTFVNNGLNFTLTKGTVGTSGADIYYCVDTTNVCTPNTKVESGTKITGYNSRTTDYYFRYRIVSNAGSSSTIGSFKAKFDTVKPVCSFKTAPLVHAGKAATLDMECTDALSGVQNINLIASSFTLNNNNLSIESVSKSTITNGIKYTLTLKGQNQGDTKISLNDNVVKDNAGNIAQSTNKTVNIMGAFTVTLNNNGATKNGSTSAKVYYNGTTLSSIELPQRNYTVTFNDNNQNATISSLELTSSYVFNGWYSSANQGVKVADSNTTPNLQASVSDFTNSEGKWTRLSDATLYASWTSKSITLPTITKQNHICKWNTNSLGTGTNFGSGESYTPSSNVTLFAKCELDKIVLIPSIVCAHTQCGNTANYATGGCIYGSKTNPSNENIGIGTNSGQTATTCSSIDASGRPLVGVRGCGYANITTAGVIIPKTGCYEVVLRGSGLANLDPAAPAVVGIHFLKGSSGESLRKLGSYNDENLIFYAVVDQANIDYSFGIRSLVYNEGACEQPTSGSKLFSVEITRIGDTNDSNCLGAKGYY